MGIIVRYETRVTADVNWSNIRRVAISIGNGKLTVREQIKTRNEPFANVVTVSRSVCFDSERHG